MKRDYEFVLESGFMDPKQCLIADETYIMDASSVVTVQG
jgi:hypothetical protein